MRVEASQSQNILRFVLRNTHIEGLTSSVHFYVSICITLVLFCSLYKETFLTADFHIRPSNLHLTLPKSSKYATTPRTHQTVNTAAAPNIMSFTQIRLSSGTLIRVKILLDYLLFIRHEMIGR